MPLHPGLPRLPKSSARLTDCTAVAGRLLHFPQQQLPEEPVQNRSFPRDLGKKTRDCEGEVVSFWFLGVGQTYELYWRSDYGTGLLLAVRNATRRLLLCVLLVYLADPPGL